MNHAYFNQILHLLQQHPKQGKRLTGLGVDAFWQLWQQVEEFDKVTRQQRAQQPERQRQAGGGAKRSANVVSRTPGVFALPAAALDDACIGSNHWL
jgi:hypothetical protein